VQRRYANAGRYLDYRRYDHAIEEYEAAEKAMPDYPETQWRLGLLYEAYGDVARTREHLTRYKQLETDTAQAERADAHLSTLDSRRAGTIRWFPTRMTR